MKLKQEEITKLTNVLNCSSLAKIENLLLEEKGARGMDADKSVVMITKDKGPDIGDLSVGINRINDLSSRIDLVKDGENFTINLVPAPNVENEVSKLELSSSLAKAEFRTAQRGAKIPKAFKNWAPHWLISVNKDLLKTIDSASKSVTTKSVILTSKATGEVSLEFVDGVTADVVNVKVADSATWIPTEDDPKKQVFVHYYNLATFLPLLKEASKTGDIHLVLDQFGRLQMSVNEIEFTLVPRANGEQ